MPRLIITSRARDGAIRCREFLAEKSPQAAARAGQAMVSRLAMLEITPEMGRPFNSDASLRELPIPFGDSGYVALYRYDRATNTVYVLAIRHQREAGYRQG